MGTPHNEAKLGQIAKTVVMPGDPLRAKWIAREFLSGSECVNTVRGMLAYTGTYGNRRMTVMGHGMGMPSVGIYVHELYHEYGVETILRVGSAGGIADDIRVHDIVLAMGACTDSAYARQFGLPGSFAPIADFGLLQRAVAIALDRGQKVKVGNILSTDVFYQADETANDRWKAVGVLAVEMETAALYMEAAAAGKKALSLLTVSDHLYTGEALSPQERQTGFSDMVRLALEIPD